MKQLSRRWGPSGEAAKGGIGIILHLGAKVRALPVDFSILDPKNFLQWLGKDRATVGFSSLKDIADKRAAFQSVTANGSAMSAPRESGGKVDAPHVSFCQRVLDFEDARQKRL
jgi:hypothetical protein